MENEHLHMFGFVESSLISKPIAPSTSVDKWAVALANQFLSAARGVLFFVPYNKR